jgi:hypothetical protein
VRYRLLVQGTRSSVVETFGIEDQKEDSTLNSIHIISDALVQNMGSKLLSSAPFRQVYLNSFSCCVSQGRSVSKQAKILTSVSLLSSEGFDYTTS